MILLEEVRKWCVRKRIYSFTR